MESGEIVLELGLLNSDLKFIQVQPLIPCNLSCIIILQLDWRQYGNSLAPCYLTVAQMELSEDELIFLQLIWSFFLRLEP